MPELPRHVAPLLVAAAVLWHLLAAVAPGWSKAVESNNGRDFASYYYAAKVASEGGDPYDKAALGAASRSEGRKGGVHPFFYPPPFLLGASWVKGLGLEGAYRVWFWLDVLAGAAAAVVLWRWLEPIDPWAGVAVALGFAAMTCLGNNHVMGQANLPVLLVALLGLWGSERGRPWLGGALVGLACMWKMSPALFVLWWLLRREFKPVAASIAAALVLSLLSLLVVDFPTQLRFYTEVLPAFGSGDYNGLSVPIRLYGNHSIPNLWDALLPGEGSLSSGARLLSLLSTLAVLGTLAAAFHRPTPDLPARAAQLGAVGIAMLFIPVYTYEHHLVWALPALAVALLGIRGGRLGAAWLPVVALAAVVLCYDQQELKSLANALRPTAEVLFVVVRESKFGALLALFAANLQLGRVHD